MPSHIGFMGMTIGRHMITVSAWDSPDDPETLLRRGMHKEAMTLFFGPGVASRGFTSFWTPDRINLMWVRCTARGTMSNAARFEGLCECGQPLPEPMIYR